MFHPLLDLSFLGIPGDVWIGSLLALAIGIITIIVAKSPKTANWFRLNTKLRQEITRDIGIAFLVAAVVSLTYEWSTRITAEHKKIEGVLHTTLGSVVTTEVWNEVNSEVFHRQVRREDIVINLKLSRNATLANGEQVPTPLNQAVLWMEYTYNLYNLKTSYARIDVQHSLDMHMLNNDLQLPRFEKLMINGVPQDLTKVLDSNKGSIKLEGANRVGLPPSTPKSPVRIATERYEIVGLPGVYNIVLPELASGTIKVSFVEPLPQGVEAEVSSGWAEHKFESNASRNVWTFNGIMLPGQGIIVVFRNIRP